MQPAVTPGAHQRPGPAPLLRAPLRQYAPSRLAQSWRAAAAAAFGTALACSLRQLPGPNRRCVAVRAGVRREPKKRRPAGSAPGRRGAFGGGFSKGSAKKSVGSPKSFSKADGKAAKRPASLDFDFPDPLAACGDSALHAIWESEEMLQILDGMRFSSGERLQSYAFSAQMMSMLVEQYSLLLTTGQLRMLSSTLAADAFLSTRSEHSVTTSPLEEPLSWRKMSNRLGLTTYALDMFVCDRSFLLVDQSQMKDEARGNKGFGKEKTGKVDTFGVPVETQAGDEDYWMLVHGVADMFRLHSGSTEWNKPRVVVSSDLFAKMSGNRHLSKLDREMDVCVYQGDSPRRDLLVTVSNCVVIVIKESTWSCDEFAWTLDDDAICADDGEVAGPSAAPVVVLSVLEREMQVGTHIIQRIRTTYQNVHDKRNNKSGDPFSFLNPFQDAVAITDEVFALQSEVGPLLTECYKVCWAQIREDRLEELRAAKLQVGRLERQRSLLAGAKQKLQEPLRLLDRSLFNKRSAEVLADRAMTQAQVNEYSKRFDQLMDDAQQPLMELVAARCSAAKALGAALSEASPRAETDAEVLDALQRGLERSALPQSNLWVVASRALCSALSGGERVRLAVLAASDPVAEGEQVSELSQAVASFTIAVSSFETAVNTATAPGEPVRAPVLQQAAAEARMVLGKVQADLTLREALSSAPWAGGPLEFAAIGAGATKALESLAAVATDAGRERVAGRLQVALAAGKCAGALRKALAGSDRDVIVRELQAARDLGFTGLEDVEERVAQLEAGVAALRASLEAAVVELDVGAFESALEDARGRGVELPGTEATRLKATLAEATEEAEVSLRGLLESAQPPGEEEVRAAAERLPEARVVRRLAEVALEATVTVASLLEVVANPAPAEAEQDAVGDAAASDATGRVQMLLDVKLAAEVAQRLKDTEGFFELQEARLKASLAQGRQASEQLQSALQAAGVSRGFAADLSSSLRDALSRGEERLAGASADRSLARTLSELPWRGGAPALMGVSQEDVSALEDKAGWATSEGRSRLSDQLDAALQVGRCVASLGEAMRGPDADALETRIGEAELLGLPDLGEAQDRVDELRRATAAAERQRVAQAAAEKQRAEQRAEQAAAAAEKAAQARQAAEQRAAEQRAAQAAAAAARGGGGSSASADAAGADRAAEQKWGQAAMQNSCSNLIFFDLELTSGFYDFDHSPKILEVAVLITDQDLNELGRGAWVVGGFTQAQLDSLDPWHQAHFRDPRPGGLFPPLPGQVCGNGLFADVLASRRHISDVEDSLMELVCKHCPAGACPLVGYSVQCDREVLMEEMPRFYRHLSHRIIDVSTFFQMARVWTPDRLQRWESRASRYNHRASNDVEDSLEALRFVREHLFAAGSGPAGATWNPKWQRSGEALSVPKEDARLSVGAQLDI